MNGLIAGLCNAFFTLNEVVLRNNWFHSRDFVFLCRYLRLQASLHPATAPLFSAAMLLQGLRRHFQTVRADQFPLLAQHFLLHCGLLDDDVDDLDAHVVESLRDSLRDNVDIAADATAAHCRYTLIVDPTDSECAIDLLRAMQLVSARVEALSDFPDDATPTRQTAVLASIKQAIEAGDCILLKNSAPLQSALYDVINRHYAMSTYEDPNNPGVVIREAFANISLGSFSRYVKVHPNFRLIVHIPESQLPMTPLPFLNRLEKYPLSVRDALTQQINHIALHPPACLRTIRSEELRRSLINALKTGVDDFVAFAGGSSAFYGFPPSEAIPAIILRCLTEEALSSSSGFQIPPSTLSLIMANGSEEASSAIPQDTPTEGEADLSADFDMDLHNTSALGRIKALVRELNYQVLETARVESIFHLRHRLPAAYVKQYIDHQEHLSVVALMSRIVHYHSRRSLAKQLPIKLVTYTRTGKSSRAHHIETFCGCY